MRYTGQFRNINNDLITVQITINNQATPIIQITRENGLWFSADPIQIATDIDDTFEHLIRKSCTINLITNGYVGTDLFAENARSVEVEILNGDVCLFHGYLEPNTFNEINCFGIVKDESLLNYDVSSFIKNGAKKAIVRQNSNILLFDKKSTGKNK